MLADGRRRQVICWRRTRQSQRGSCGADAGTICALHVDFQLAMDDLLVLKDLLIIIDGAARYIVFFQYFKPIGRVAGLHGLIQMLVKAFPINDAACDLGEIFIAGEVLTIYYRTVALPLLVVADSDDDVSIKGWVDAIGDQAHMGVTHSGWHLTASKITRDLVAAQCHNAIEQ